MRIARIFNTYGPRMCIDDGRVVSNFVAQVYSFVLASFFKMLYFCCIKMDSFMCFDLFWILLTLNFVAGLEEGANDCLW